MLAGRQTDRPTDRQTDRHGHHSTRLPYRRNIKKETFGENAHVECKVSLLFLVPMHWFPVLPRTEEVKLPRFFQRVAVSRFN